MGKSADILKMIGSSSKTSTVIEPDIAVDNRVVYRPELVYGYEPNFVKGYKIRCGKHSIDEGVVGKAMVRNDHIRAVGPSGAGKSTLAGHEIDLLNAEVLKENKIIHERNLPLIDVGAPVDKLEKYHELNYIGLVYNGHVGTTYEQMVGTLDLMYDEHGNRHAVRVPGFLSYAFTTPKVKLIWDEMDYTPAEALGAANIFLDGRTTSIDVFVNGKWTLRKQDNFSVFATTNSLNGENQDEYAGVNPMNGAFSKRFNFIIHLDFLPEQQETDLLMKKFPTFRRDIAEQMVLSANKTRVAKASGAIEYELSTRELCAWVRSCLDHPEQPVSRKEYWDKVADLYLYTSFLNRIDSVSVRDGYAIYFTL